MIKALPLPHSLLGPNSGSPYGSSSLWWRMGRACSSHTSLHALFPVRVGKRKAENRSLLPRLSKVSVLSVDRDSGLPVGWWPLQPLLLLGAFYPASSPGLSSHWVMWPQLGHHQPMWEPPSPAPGREAALASPLLGSSFSEVMPSFFSPLLW